jgi:hypothetical protein
MTTPTAQPTRCLRCHRVLRSAKSIAAGYGAGCRARIRAAAMAEAVKGFAAAQVEKARELIEDGAIVPTNRKGVFRVVSSDGERSYLATADVCNCPSGLKRLTACTCKHSLGVRIVAASGKAA